MSRADCPGELSPSLLLLCMALLEQAIKTSQAMVHDKLLIRRLRRAMMTETNIKKGTSNADAYSAAETESKW